MAARERIAKVEVCVFSDGETEPLCVEVREWRRGGQSHLTGILEFHGDQLDNEETDEVQACTHAAVAWMLSDGVALASGRIL
jgi:hypothetical protein